MKTEYLKDKPFIDTCILVYAYLDDGSIKHGVAEELIRKIFDGETQGYISNQVFAELSKVLITKYSLGVGEVTTIVKGICSSKNWKVVNYNQNTILNCLSRLKESEKLPFFDVLITETMKENGLERIITENEDDFNKIPGIQVRNPFK